MKILIVYHNRLSSVGYALQMTMKTSDRPSIKIFVMKRQCQPGV